MPPPTFSAPGYIYEFVNGQRPTRDLWSIFYLVKAVVTAVTNVPRAELRYD